LQTSGSLAGLPWQAVRPRPLHTTSDRCQRRSVSARTRNAPQRPLGRIRLAAASSAVPVPVDRPLDLPAQDLELVAKDKGLGLCGVVGAMFRRDKGERPTRHHAED
jgi:hypothetical protein